MIANVCCYEHASEDIRRQRMIVCSTCRNKRCPKATNHDLTCTNSNESGQPGSRYSEDYKEEAMETPANRCSAGDCGMPRSTSVEPEYQGFCEDHAKTEAKKKNLTYLEPDQKKLLLLLIKRLNQDTAAGRLGISDTDQLALCKELDVSPKSLQGLINKTRDALEGRK